jgi:hypothetical protein
MLKFEVEGLKELQRDLRRLEARAQSPDGTDTVPIKDLLTPSFISRHVMGAGSLDEWFEKSGFKIESQEDFGAIPDAVWDERARSTTDFASWQQMLEAAAGELVGRKPFG